ncbi:MAG: aquaporin [Bacteroidota bacterium]
MKKYLVEFIGTFLFVLVIVVAVNNGAAGGFAALAIGATLMVVVYAGGHISGGHYNPAVTLAVFMRGKCEGKDVLPYILSQILGAALAALTGAYLLGTVEGATVPANPASLNMLPSLVAEFIGTFALCYVVLQTATTVSTVGNSYYGLAIGFTVTVMAYSLGAVSGGAFNPAVAVGITTASMKAWADIWIFLVANFAGGAVAALVFSYVYGRGE